jgi:hypothetical protein
MLAELSAWLPGVVGVFGERTPVVVVASSICCTGLPLVAFPDEPVKATPAGVERPQVPTS